MRRINLSKWKKTYILPFVHTDEDMPHRAEVQSPAIVERHFDLTMANSDVEVGATALDPVAPTMSEPPDNSEQMHSTTVDSDGTTPQESEILSQPPRRRRRLVLVPGRDERVADQDADTESITSRRMVDEAIESDFPTINSRVGTPRPRNGGRVAEH